MIFVRSIKQLLRAPVTTALFIILFAVAALFVSSGTVIWAFNNASVKAYEDVFLTIGTVRQLATSMETIEKWDAGTREYSQRSVPQFSSVIPPSVLDFDGAGYMLGPEKRPYYGAFCPDIQLLPETHSWERSYIIVAAPLLDCIPSAPVDVRIEKVIARSPPEGTPGFGNLKDGQIIPLCDHYNDAPQPLYVNKTYIMYVQAGVHVKGAAQLKIEYHPIAVSFSTQYRPGGARLEDNINAPAIREINDGFYETEEGRRWLEYAEAFSTFHAYNTLPVLPVSWTNLLLPFYNGSAYIVEGEDITSDEYEYGERVCLVSYNFAKMNGLSPGSMLRLPLYYADYKNAPNDLFGEIDPDGYAVWKGSVISGSLLNAKGEIYQIFSDHEYTVKGIYISVYGRDASFAMGNNTVVIPAASVRESDENNIIAYGPMKDTTTAFQIPNGSIESYMEKWLSHGNNELELTFYDRGYTQLQRGLDSMKRVSIVLLTVGAAMSLTLVFFFCYVFISKNKMRTAIERMLGYTKKQCAASLLSGFLIFALLSAAVGCATGIYAGGQITNGFAQRDYYDASYTIGPLGKSGVSLDKPEISAIQPIITGLALLYITIIVSAVFMHDNVKEEPLKLLGGRKE